MPAYKRLLKLKVESISIGMPGENKVIFKASIHSEAIFEMLMVVYLPCAAVS